MCAGKTKILDRIRHTNVQNMEAGGITQQIGATFVPVEAIRTQTQELKKELDFKLPGLLIIDTPGHESFSNLRSRGSGLCDIAVLVIDIMHGLEPQTIESIGLLKMRKTPFIVALNKVDRCYDWKVNKDAPFEETLAKQAAHVQAEFQQRAAAAMLELNQQGLNCELYYKNTDFRKFVSLVPTSAITGEGIPDLLYLITQLTQQMMASKLGYLSELQCTVLEVKMTEGFGVTIDVILVNGVLHSGDVMVLCGLEGPIVTPIRTLLTPHPLKEIRVKGEYIHLQEVKAAMGVKIAAKNLDHVLAGTPMFVCSNPADLEGLKDLVQADLASIYKTVQATEKGVYVQASTLGSLEALLAFLKTSNIPVSGVGIGPIHKKDVMKASTMLDKQKEYATILAFDVKVVADAQAEADKIGVKIFTADIIYHLFDMFTKYMEEIRTSKREDAASEAVFPCVLEILPDCVFNAKDPIIVGVQVKDGLLKIGTPFCVPTQKMALLGRCVSIEDNHVPKQSAKKGDKVCVRLELDNKFDSQPLYGRHYTLKVCALCVFWVS
jgi:translation initiation factor 5B